MQTRKKQFEEDDGRVIANMDVDGMPWHDRRARFEERLDQRRKGRKEHKCTAKESQSLKPVSTLFMLF